jgi:hypothetical protein
MAEIKKFLDYGGLETLWGIITNRFADKDKTITALEISANEAKTTQTIVATLADGTTQKTVDLPNADRTQAGLMSADHFAMVEDLTANIEEMAPFAGLQLKNDSYTEEVSLTGRKATIELKYEKDDTAGKAYISLLDPTYPAEGNWVVKTEADYNAVKDSLVKDGQTMKDTNGTGWAVYHDTTSQTKGYWQWSIPGATGPVNAVGKPIQNKPISKIDVSELLKTGLLESSEMVSKGGKTMIKLGFNVTKGGVDDVEYQYIDVTDLVDIYTPGDGIEIVERTSEPVLNSDGTLDYTATETKIQLTYATDDKRGAIRTGYTAAEGGVRHYAVQLVTTGDDTGKAFVAVPWDTHTVAVYSTGKTAAGEDYIKITDESQLDQTGVDGSKKHEHKFKVEVAEGLKKAEALSRTAAQELTGDTNYVVITGTQIGESAEKGEGKNWSITLDQTVKDSLALADSAVQEIAAGAVRGENDLVVTVDKENVKGEKNYTITLGSATKDSLNLADSAVQEITLFNTTINKEDSVYTEEDITKDLSLGNAIKVNVSGSISKEDDTTDQSAASYDSTGATKIDNVPTVKAVKTYVESVKGDVTGEYEQFVSGVVAGLDSNMEIDTIDAESTAQKVAAKSVFTKIVIEDGKLVGPNAVDAEGNPLSNRSECRELVLSDITDFRAFTTAEIYTICGATMPQA